MGIAYYCNSSLKWTVEEAVYFISISITTVGYGDLHPLTDRAKVFTMAYVGVGFIAIYQIITGSMHHLFEHATMRIQKRKQDVSQSDVAKLPTDDKDVDAAAFYKKLFYISILVFMQLLGAGFIMWMENWSFLTSFYWAYQTATTIGYGEQGTVPTLQGSHLFASAYALASVGALGASLAGLETTRQEAKAEKDFRRLMRSEIDPDMLTSLDRDGQGVDKAEFVVGMLVCMDAVNERECAALMDRFDELDHDRTGRLTHHDLVVIAQRLRGERVHAMVEGSTVRVVKAGSSKYGALGKVTDPNWNGLVKVVLDGHPSTKSYLKVDLELVASGAADRSLAEEDLEGLVPYSP